MPNLHRPTSGVKRGPALDVASNRARDLLTPPLNRREDRVRYRRSHLSVTHLLVPTHLREVLLQHHPRLFDGVSTSRAHTPIEVKARLSVLLDYLFGRCPDKRGEGGLRLSHTHLRGMFVDKSAKRALTTFTAWLEGAGVRADVQDYDFPSRRSRSVRLTFHPEVAAAIEAFESAPFHAPGGWLRLDSSDGKPLKDGTSLKVQRQRRRVFQKALRGCPNPVLRARLAHFLDRPRSFRREMNKNLDAAREAAEAQPTKAARLADQTMLRDLQRMPYCLPTNRPGKESARIGGTYNPAQLSESVRRALFPSDLEFDAAASWFCVAVALAFDPSEPEYREAQSWIDGSGDPWGELTKRLLPRLRLPIAQVEAEPGLFKFLRKKLKHFVQMNLCGAMPWERPSGALLTKIELPGCRWAQVYGFYDAVLEDPLVAALLRRLYGPWGLADRLTRDGVVVGKNGQQITMRLEKDEPLWDRYGAFGEVIMGRLPRARRALAAAFAQVEGAAIVAAYDYVKRWGRGKVFARFDSHDGFNLGVLRRDRRHTRLIEGMCAAFKRELRRRGCFGAIRLTYQPLKQEKRAA